MANKKIKVLIVDDSLVFVNFLSKGLPEADSNIEIVGYAMNAAEAMRKIPIAKPDIITLDVEMPRTNGFCQKAGYEPELQHSSLYTKSSFQDQYRF